VLLTDPQLLGCFRRRFRDRGAIGYCCAGCGRTRAEALTASPHVGECEVAVVDDKRNRR
jgi:hypothetical protein